MRVKETEVNLDGSSFLVKRNTKPLTESQELLVATPGTSWSLLDSIMDPDDGQQEAGVIVQMGDSVSDVEDDDDDDDEDDGFAMEESRLDEIAKRLSAMESETPAAYADVFSEPPPLRVEKEAGVEVVFKLLPKVLPLPKVAKKGPMILTLALASLAVYLCALSARSYWPTPPLRAADECAGLECNWVDSPAAVVEAPYTRAAASSTPPTVLSDKTARPKKPQPKATSPPPKKPQPKKKEQEKKKVRPLGDFIKAEKLRNGGKGLGAFGDAIAEAATKLESSIAESFEDLAATENRGNAVLKLTASAGLGIAGLLVGVPYVPGITDNLFVAGIGAALPFFGKNDKEQSTNKDDKTL